MSEHAPATAYTSEQAKVYDERRFTRPSGKRVHHNEYQSLLWALNRIPRDGHVLEVGCGTGRLLLDARAAGYRVDGLDGSADMLAQLRAKAGNRYPDLQLTTAEAAKLPFPDGSYDLVYCIRLLNQTESPAYALDTIADMIRVTKPGGYVLAEFVNAYRPRLGVARRSTTRLRPTEAARRAVECGATVVGFRGAFLLGMQAYHVAGPLLGIVDSVDRGLSAVLPRLCSRTYILLRKGSGA